MQNIHAHGCPSCANTKTSHILQRTSLAPNLAYCSVGEHAALSTVRRMPDAAVPCKVPTTHWVGCAPCTNLYPSPADRSYFRTALLVQVRQRHALQPYAGGLAGAPRPPPQAGGGIWKEPEGEGTEHQSFHVAMERLGVTKLGKGGCRLPRDGRGLCRFMFRYECG